MPLFRTTMLEQLLFWDVTGGTNMFCMRVERPSMVPSHLPRHHSRCRAAVRADTIVIDFHGFVVSVLQGSSLRHAERILRRNSILERCANYEQMHIIFVLSGNRFIHVEKCGSFDSDKIRFWGTVGL